MNVNHLLSKWKNWVISQVSSIQFHIALSFSILILVIIAIVGMVSYQKFSTTLEQNAEEYNYQIINQVKENIDFNIQHMDNISSTIQSNANLQQYLSNPSLDPEQKKMAEEKIGSFLQMLVHIRNDIVSIFILNGQGDWINSDPSQTKKENVDLNLMDWYSKAKQAHGQSVVTSSHVNTLYNNPRWVVSMSRELYGDSKGVLLIDLNYNTIQQICQKVHLGKDGYIFIVDSQGQIVYHPKQALIYNKLAQEKIDEVMKAKSQSFVLEENGEKKLYTITQSNVTGWRIVSATTLSEIILDGKESRNFIFIVMMVGIYLAIFIAFIISKKISKPIKILELSMKEVEKGNFDNSLPTISANNEIGRLSKTFKIMTIRVKELMEQIVNEQKVIRKSEMKALQSQINPHFLYNTLDSIIWMVEGGENQEVIEMTSSLAKLFRISLNKGEEVISLAYEIEHVKHYLTIQKIRYKNKFDFIIDVEEEIYSYHTIKLILQPLVENAIYHGIKNLPGKGLIKILGWKESDRIVLQVFDNGIGMSKPNMDGEKKGSGIGLKNVCERLRIYYGELYGLSIESGNGEGTMITITIPLEWDQNNKMS